MTNKKKRGKRKVTKRARKSKGLYGLSFKDTGQSTAENVGMQTVLSVIGGIFGAAAGSVFGSASLLGVVLGAAGIAYKIPFLASLGFTAAATPLAKDIDQNLYKVLPGGGTGTPTNVPATTNGVDDLDGFNIKQFGSDAKARAGAYFKNLAEKLTFGKYKPEDVQKAIQTVQGLFGPDESVSYFLNPGTSGMGDVDFSALDKLKAQIAQANAPNNNQNLTGEENGEDDFAGII